MTSTIEERIGAHYTELSSKLRVAADYVASNPVDVATRSLRSVAQTSGVSPATFSRLARILGFSDYEELREAGRMAVGQRLVPFAERAEKLRKGDQSAARFFSQQIAASVQNMNLLEQSVSTTQLEDAVIALNSANKVFLIGSLGSAGIVEYFAYQAQFFAQNWAVDGRGGASAASYFAHMETGDAVICLTMTPYAEQSLRAVRVAFESGFKTLVITDSHASPALKYASHQFIVPTETANFFSSYVPAVVLIETLISMLVARVGEEAETRIRATEQKTKMLSKS